MPKVVAEACCNHKGDFEIALQMIKTASQFCDVDVIKFQKRDVEAMLTSSRYAVPHPNPRHAYGNTYGEHRKALEFDIGQHRVLQETCRLVGIEYSCSVWDPVSAREIASLEPGFIKVPSAANLYWAMLDVLLDRFGGEIHVSLGMTTRAEEESIVRYFEDRGRGGDLVLYACTSDYPVAFSDVCLGEIPRLRQSYGGRVKAIGFSGHHLGIAVDIAALALGAEWFERHFTLNRTWKGTDHAASLEPDGLRRLCRDLRGVSQALGPKPEEILPAEWPQRKKLKWSPGADG